MLTPLIIITDLMNIKSTKKHTITTDRRTDGALNKKKNFKSSIFADKLCDQPIIRQRTNSRATLVDQGPRRLSWFGFRLTNSPASPYSARSLRQHHITLSRLLALYQEAKKRGGSAPSLRLASANLTLPR